MRNPFLKYLRIIVAFIVAVLCVLAFYSHIYPVKIFDWQFSALLQNILLGGALSFSVIFLVLCLFTFIFGRVYCSAFCPLGIYQQFLVFLFKPFVKNRQIKPVKKYQFSLWFALILFAMLFGGSAFFLRYVEPYSVAGNALSGCIFGLLFASALAVLVFFKKRFFCTNICPVGAVLGLAGKVSLLKIHIDKNKCITCGHCAKTCPAQCIDFKNKAVNNEMCLKCFACLSVCKYGALSYGVKQGKDIPFNPSRRKFLIGTAALLVGAAAFKSGLDLSKKVVGKVKNVLIPAGGGSIEEFSNRCLNCNLCVQNCPQHIIKKATAEIPFVHLSYAKNHCRYDCNKCSQVCPSGAIKKISLAQKQKTKIATAFIDEQNCIQCGHCVYVCPRKIIFKNYGQLPVIKFDSCIGCGACVKACPVEAISITPASKQIILN